MKVLLAEDDPVARLLAEKTLRSLGHECTTVNDGAEAWDAFSSDRPEVVLSDWIMPGLTGLELCHKIRTRPSNSYTYFIIVTSHGGLDEILEGMTAGADDYLVKPLSSDDLRARLVPAARVTSLHAQLDRQRTELEGLNRELTAIGLRDPLTGLGNRRALTEDLGQLEARAVRYGHRYCLALLDVDHFKSYNDTYGHQAGDQALQAVAEQLMGQARTGDAVYRYGGEEFLCIFPEQSTSKATVAAERMRGGLEALTIPHTGSSRGVLTLSAGLALMDAGDTRSVDEVLKEADEALYRAKRLGRNRVEHAIEHDGGSDLLRQLRQAGGLLEQTARVVDGPKLLDEAVIADLENLGGEVLTDLLSLYFDQATELVAELSGAVGDGQPITVGRTAHKLNGSSKTIGAACVSHIASELERTAKAGDLSAADKLLVRLRGGLAETRTAFRSRVPESHEDN